MRENSLDAFIGGAKKRVTLENSDLVIAITGIRPGCGKSTVGRMIAKRLDENFTIKKNMLAFPNLKEIKKLTEETEKGSIVFMDEFMEIGFSQDWAKETSKELVKFFQMEARKFNKIYLIVIQNFWELHSSLRNNRVNYWFFIPKRGFCVVFEPDTHAFTDDPWNRKEAIKQKEKSRMRFGSLLGMGAEEQITMYQKLPNYSFAFEFDKPVEASEKEYLEAVAMARNERKKLELLPQDETNKLLRLQRRSLVAYTYNICGKTQEQIAEAAGISTEVVNLDLKLSHSRKIDKKRLVEAET